ncbi:MAG: hypothetical protein FJX71_06065 [Alphaproteobacteria bacterium]|nr:hypothetical protein [Alphaproteobacteria bacterium]
MESLKQHLNSVKPGELGELELGNAHQFVAGTATSPTLLCILAANSDHFKKLNETYAQALKEYKKADGSPEGYVFNSYTSGNYIPHLAVGSGDGDIVKKVQTRLDNYRQENNGTNYKAKIGSILLWDPTQKGSAH